MSRLRRLGHRLLGQADSHDADRVRFAIGSLHAMYSRSAPTMRNAEFGCYSQFGEDGAIQWLLGRVPIANESFVEVGVEDYHESNTRFLLQHDNWRGRIIDSGVAHLAFVMASELAWRHSIDARSAFVTRDNIDELLADLPRDLGLLSLDIDGNDYWVLDAMTVVEPRILIVEYNSIWGPDRAVAVPYDPDFDRTTAHSSWLYWGASIAALHRLASSRGYRLAGSNSTGHNAFFVRSDVAGDVPDLAPDQAWVESRYRESRGPGGELTYVDSHASRRALIANMPLVDVSNGDPLLFADI